MHYAICPEKTESSSSRHWRPGQPSEPALPWRIVCCKAGSIQFANSNSIREPCRAHAFRKQGTIFALTTSKPRKIATGHRSTHCPRVAVQARFYECCWGSAPPQKKRQQKASSLILVSGECLFEGQFCDQGMPRAASVSTWKTRGCPAVLSSPATSLTFSGLNGNPPNPKEPKT